MSQSTGHVGPAFEGVRRDPQMMYVPLNRSEVLVVLWALFDLVKNGQPAERELANDLWRKMYGWYGNPPSRVGDRPLVTLNESVWD